MIKPQIISSNIIGENEKKYNEKIERLSKANTYKNLSTICIIATRGTIPAKVLNSWFNLITPMNQAFIRLFAMGMEVGVAYSQTIEMILNNPELSKFKYILTLEEDNIPPPDGLLNLYENIENYSAIGGLYFTKGELGQPMIYGDPTQQQINFIPQLPKLNTIQECNGIGMGFSLFDINIFRDERIEKPWFKTVQQIVPNQPIKQYTQDLYFFEKIRKLGYKVACDTRVKVGHYDLNSDIVW